MDGKKRTGVITPEQALLKAQRWCAFQERCQQETRDKLYAWGQSPAVVENIIAELIAQNFINEERFARAYAGGKFRIKKWGRIKIRVELKRKKVSDYCIKKALQEIDDREYLRVLKKLAEEKSRTEKEKHYLKKKYKIMRYLIAKGFESDLVKGVMQEEL